MDIDPTSGRWIYSASEAHNEEQQFELWRLNNWLDRFNLTPIGLTETATLYHASGHISGRELRELVYAISPRQGIPIHTVAPHRFREILLSDTDTQLPQAGVPLSIG